MEDPNRLPIVNINKDHIGLTVTKPIAVWNQSLSVNFRDLFQSLGKGIIDGAFGQWSNLGGDLIDILAATGLGKIPEHVAWVLIFRSLKRAMENLLESNKNLLVKDPENLREICDHLNQSLENISITIDLQFFQYPKKLPLLKYISSPLKEWLKSFVETEVHADSICQRLPSYFVFALHEEWRTKPKDYACLTEQLQTPFTQAGERERNWLRYAAWLQRQIEIPIFLEAFGLKQIYVHLHAYYTRKQNSYNDEILDKNFEDRMEKIEKIVVNLEEYLNNWLDKGNRDDAIKIISGGPGCGKSSFLKVFASNQITLGKRKVLFIPLNLINLADDLIESVGKFILNDGFLSTNPLLFKNSESFLLIIFDGLDELAMQGKAGAEAAQYFVQEVQKTINRFNDRSTDLIQVLISGRELVIQATKNDFRKSEQILNIMPYFVSEDHRHQYMDSQNLLKKDLRNSWWFNYSRLNNLKFLKLPDELDKDALVEITSQPLLNYLVALSYRWGKLNISSNSNLNTIYRDLLEAVYERDWATHQHTVLRGVSKDDFIRILEEIALATWHGDGQKSSVYEIESHCNSSGLKTLLKKFQEGAKNGVIRMLVAFYFRESDQKNDGEQTFEFTHKSFEEYLVARRIIRGVKRIQKMRKRRLRDPDDGWDESESLAHWAMICGPSLMNTYIYIFIENALKLEAKSHIEDLQIVLSELLTFMLHYGMPMEQLRPRPSYQEAYRQARNAEEALLAIIHACAIYTQRVSTVNWPSPDTFGSWIRRLQGQRIGADNVLSLSCMGLLNLKNCTLYFSDFYEANFAQAKLDKAKLDRANLVGAILNHVSLTHTSLVGTILNRASLIQANLSNAILNGASLNNAVLDQSILINTSFNRATLNKASLNRSILDKSSFLGANLVGANLTGASLKGSNLVRANLNGANLEGASLTEANLEGASLKFTKGLTVDQIKSTHNWKAASYDEEFKNRLHIDEG